MPAKKKTPKPSESNRRLKKPTYKSFRVSKRISHPGPQLSSGRVLLRNALRHMLQHRKVFLGVLCMYGLLTLVLVRGFGVDATVQETKEVIEGFLQGASAKLIGGVSLFGVLLGNSADISEAASAYQSILVTIVSLALIWVLRQTYADTKVSTRDAFYKGLYPLIPFVLVIMVIGLQLLPLLGANTLYGFVFSNGIAVTLMEKVLWAVLLFLMALLTFYMITSSIFALYIVTLPDVQPIQALRSARELVRFRRWTVMRKLLFLPVIMFSFTALVIIPLLLFATPLAEWVYFALSILALGVIHGYLYALYRELIT